MGLMQDILAFSSKRQDAVHGRAVCGPITMDDRSDSVLHVPSVIAEPPGEAGLRKESL
jgi:hypothetical protein